MGERKETTTFQKIGLRRFERAGNPASAWVNLNASEDELRKGLKGKWRNQLKKSEGHGLSLKATTSQDDFLWLAKQHETNMKEVGFSGPSFEFLKAIQENSVEGNQFITLIPRNSINIELLIFFYF